MGSGLGGIRHVCRQGFVVFAPAVRTPGHQAEYVILDAGVEPRSLSSVPVQYSARTIWSTASPQLTPPTVSPSPSSSIHTSTGSISPNPRYRRPATTSTSRPLYSMPLASCLAAYTRPCILSRTAPSGSSWVPRSGRFSTST